MPTRGRSPLEALWPSLASVKDGDDLEAFASHPVRNHVGCPGNYEFSRTGHSAGSPKTRQLGWTFDGRQECKGSTGRRVRIVACDVSTKISEVTDGARRPDDGHTRGAFRSRLRPQERSHVDTSL